MPTPHDRHKLPRCLEGPATLASFWAVSASCLLLMSTPRRRGRATRGCLRTDIWQGGSTSGRHPSEPPMQRLMLVSELRREATTELSKESALLIELRFPLLR